MFGCTACTLALPDHINYRKPTLREYVKAEHAKLEQSSIELVEMKHMEETKEPQNNAATSPVGNDATPDLGVNTVISVTPENHTEVLVGNDKDEVNADEVVSDPKKNEV